jgi:hypothetical protein
MLRNNTTYPVRFREAIASMCGGRYPLIQTVDDWLNHKSEVLQEWVLSNSSNKLIWAQGIAIIEAAMTLADNPMEGGGGDSHTGHSSDYAPKVEAEALEQDLLDKLANCAHCGGAIAYDSHNIWCTICESNMNSPTSVNVLIPLWNKRVMCDDLTGSPLEIIGTEVGYMYQSAVTKLRSDDGIVRTHIRAEPNGDDEGDPELTVYMNPVVCIRGTAKTPTPPPDELATIDMHDLNKGMPWVTGWLQQQKTSLDGEQLIYILLFIQFIRNFDPDLPDERLE